ncbi:hypothetical protein KY363_01570 [Candidatus Woesearchaeota archaeon]|nr:hypothetical protein [Candidatus Woesearchaeota archaeon]
MSIESAFENDQDYHCATCNKVYLHDTGEVVQYDDYRDRFGLSRNITSGYVCSLPCAKEWLMFRMKERIARDRELEGKRKIPLRKIVLTPKQLRKYAAQVEDYARRLENGGDKHER